MFSIIILLLSTRPAQWPEAFCDYPSLQSSALPSRLNSQNNYLLLTWQLLPCYLCLSPGCKGEWYLALMACHKGLSQGWTPTHLPCLSSAHDGMFMLFDPVSEQMPHSHRKFISEPSPKDWRNQLTKKGFDSTCTSEPASWHLEHVTVSPTSLTYSSLMTWNPSHCLWQSCLPTSPWYWGSLLPLRMADNWRGDSIIYLGLANGW